MACLKMILARRTGEIHQVTALAKEAAAYGGYVQKNGGIEGLFYKPFRSYVSERFGLEAVPMPALTVPRIIRALGDGKDIMVSVTPEIRFPDRKPARHSGHLVLVVGYDLDEGTLFIHNPSGFFGRSQEMAPVSFTVFRRFFDHKGILIG